MESWCFLCYLYLQDRDTITDFKKFYHPGALHKARWIAKIIYSIKMVLLGTSINRDLPKGFVFARSQLPKLKRFVQFVVFCYVPWWLTCLIPSAAPSHDLYLANDLIKYNSLDSAIATAALKALKSSMVRDRRTSMPCFVQQWCREFNKTEDGIKIVVPSIHHFVQV